MSKGRALGLDLGDRRIGVAICDEDRLVATPLEVIKRVGDRTVEHARVAELIAEHDVVVVVVGMPFSLSGEMGPAARKVRSEVKGLRKRLDAKVVTQDERMTTVEAQTSLHVQGVGRKKGRTVIDQVAAAVILQSWLDAGH